MQNSDRDAAFKSTIAKAYVREMLDLNPIWHSPEIMRRRREIWTGGKSVSRAAEPNAPSTSSLSTSSPPTSNASVSAQPSIDPASDPQTEHRLRVRARRCLEALETNFYQLPDEKLNQYLKFLQSDRLPEFAAKASHLRRVADQRSTLMDVGHETGDQKFTYSLQNSLIGPAAQAGALREQYIEAIITERRVAPACQMVKDFVSRHPEIYQLERDWFNLLLDPANCRQWSAKYSLAGRYRKFVSHKKANAIVAAVLLLLALSIGVIGNGKDGSKPSSRPWGGSSTARINPLAGNKEVMDQIVNRFGGPGQATGAAAQESQDAALQSVTRPQMPFGDPQFPSFPQLPSYQPPASSQPPTVSSGVAGPDARRRSAERPSGVYPGSAAPDDFLRRIREQQEKALGAHRSMMKDLEAMRSSGVPPRMDSWLPPDEIRRPSVTIPRLPLPPSIPKYDPNRFRAPSIRPRRPARAPGLGGTP